MTVDPTTFPYRPRDPDGYEPTIGLIGCGGVSRTHLDAYTKAGYDVAALCDLREERALERRDAYYPDAEVYVDHRELLERDDIDVVDVALDVGPRTTVVPDALRAGKHVLSQKPFAADLRDAEEHVRIAAEAGVKLAVNQNARWAPHFSYMREAIARDAVGVVNAVDLDVYWGKDDLPDHGREYLLFFDFAVHWFDILSCFLDDRTVERVWATTDRSPTQAADADANLLARATFEFDGAQASLTFDGDAPVASSSRAKVVGNRGVLTSEGPAIDDQVVTLARKNGSYTPALAGNWFPDGFHGAMAELCSAIEADREPAHSGRDNLRTLELTFAAVESASSGQPMVPGDVRRIEALAA